jgi:hypothetical protein
MLNSVLRVEVGQKNRTLCPLHFSLALSTHECLWVYIYRRPTRYLAGQNFPCKERRGSGREEKGLFENEPIVEHVSGGFDVRPLMHSSLELEWALSPKPRLSLLEKVFTALRLPLTHSFSTNLRLGRWASIHYSCLVLARQVGVFVHSKNTIDSN